MSHLQSIIEKCQDTIPSMKVDEIEHYQGPDALSAIEPIFRPITLQDILLCLGNIKKYKTEDGEENYVDRVFVTSDGEIVLQFGEGFGFSFFTLCKYDLTKSPYDQSEEVLEFICKNI